MLAGLQDPALMGRKRAAEEQLRGAVAAKPDLADAQDAWDRIARAQQQISRHAAEYDFLERGYGFGSSLFFFARHLLRAADERPLPNGDRLEDYRDSALPSLELELTAGQPIYNDLETVKLADSLAWLAGEFGCESPLVRKVLAGQSPRERAAQLVRGTGLASLALRRELYAGGLAALNQTRDPMIELARLADPEARAVRKIMDLQREAIRQAHAQIGKARYALHGSSQYPDATSSLRLAFGVVKGYEEDGRQIPFQTTYAGLFQRASEQHYREPFHLPPRWTGARRKLDLSVPFNFVCTADTIGGNSGSPVVNRQGELVGVIFDGNLYSLTDGVIYTEDQSRAVAVHSSGILEALRKVYQATALVKELSAGRAVR
jgi:hypothetical protein